MENSTKDFKVMETSLVSISYLNKLGVVWDENYIY